VPSTLNSSRHPFCKPWQYQDANQNWYTVNGLDRGQRWNGKTAATEDIGITAPVSAPTIGALGSGSISGTYTAYVRYVDADGVPSALSPISNTITPAGAGAIDYASVPVSPEARVTKRELYRNTDGQSTSYSLDTTINDNSTTTATSNKTDSQLEASTELPLFDDDGTPLADRFGVPPSAKRVVSELHERFIYGVSAVYTEGSVELTSGSATVTGRGNAFTPAMIGRKLFVPGQTASYTIAAVSTANNTLTLASNYAGPTDLFSAYAVQESEVLQSQWYFSAVGEPESVYATDSFAIEHYDGDVDTSAWRLGQSLFCVQQRNIWQVLFGPDPECDLQVRHIAYRGCVNPHCWVQVEGVIFALDHRGAYVFDGNGTKPISDNVQDLWRRDSRVVTHKYRLNWETRDRWFASHNPIEETVRFHVCLSGGGFPREALVYQYRRGCWWIETYLYEFGAACQAVVAGIAVPIYGWRNEVLVQHGTLDRTIEGSGVIRGTATGATMDSLTDSTATFPASYVVGAPLVIVNGTGKGQVRMIVASSGGKLTVKHPWLIRPDSTSEYAVGGIDWRWRSKAFPLAQREWDEVRRVMPVVQPTKNRATIDVRILYDHDSRARRHAVEYERQGVSVRRDETDAVLDIQIDPLTDNPDSGNYVSGFRDLNVDYRGEPETSTDRWMTVELAGVQAGDPVCVYSLGVSGVLGDRR